MVILSRSPSMVLHVPSPHTTSLRSSLLSALASAQTPPTTAPGRLLAMPAAAHVCLLPLLATVRVYPPCICLSQHLALCTSPSSSWSTTRLALRTCMLRSCMALTPTRWTWCMHSQPMWGPHLSSARLPRSDLLCYQVRSHACRLRLCLMALWRRMTCPPSRPFCRSLLDLMPPHLHFFYW